MAALKRVFLTEADHPSPHLALVNFLSAVFVLLASSVNAQPVDSTGIIEPFLPQGAQLRTLQSADLSGDGIPELLASYKIESLPYNEVGVIVLQQKDGRWDKKWGVNMSWGNSALEGSYDLLAEVADLTGDGLSEVLVHRIIGASAGNELEVYGWKEETLEKLASTGYHRLDWLPPKQGKRGLGVWEKDIGMACLVKTLRLEEHGWVNADEQYPEYFREVVVPYDQQLVEQMLDARFAWYYLAEAQVKAQMPEEALQSIERGLALDIYYPETFKFEQLKEQAQLQLKQ
jgi:hypothetical protein